MSEVWLQQFIKELLKDLSVSIVDRIDYLNKIYASKPSDEDSTQAKKLINDLSPVNPDPSPSPSPDDKTLGSSSRRLIEPIILHSRKLFLQERSNFLKNPLDTPHIQKDPLIGLHLWYPSKSDSSLNDNIKKRMRMVRIIQPRVYSQYEEGACGYYALFNAFNIALLVLRKHFTLSNYINKSILNNNDDQNKNMDSCYKPYNSPLHYENDDDIDPYTILNQNEHNKNKSNETSSDSLYNNNLNLPLCVNAHYRLCFSEQFGGVSFYHWFFSVRSLLITHSENTLGSPSNYPWSLKTIKQNVIERAHSLFLAETLPHLKFHKLCSNSLHQFLINQSKHDNTNTDTNLNDSNPNNPSTLTGCFVLPEMTLENLDDLNKLFKLIYNHSDVCVLLLTGCTDHWTATVINKIKTFPTEIILADSRNSQLTNIDLDKVHKTSLTHPELKNSWQRAVYVSSRAVSKLTLNMIRQCITAENNVYSFFQKESIKTFIYTFYSQVMKYKDYKYGGDQHNSNNDNINNNNNDNVGVNNNNVSESLVDKYFVSKDDIFSESDYLSEKEDEENKFTDLYNQTISTINHIIKQYYHSPDIENNLNNDDSSNNIFLSSLRSKINNPLIEILKYFVYDQHPGPVIINRDIPRYLTVGVNYIPQYWLNAMKLFLSFFIHSDDQAKNEIGQEKENALNHFIFNPLLQVFKLNNFDGEPLKANLYLCDLDWGALDFNERLQLNGEEKKLCMALLKFKRALLKLKQIF